MKKVLASILCLALVLTSCLAAAEAGRKDDYTVVSVNGAFNIRGITPEAYQLTDINKDDTTIGVWFNTEDPAKPSFVLVISFLEEYAGVGRLNDLSEEEMMGLVAEDSTLNDQIDIMETDYGTKVMILRSRDPKDDFACFVTVYRGYEVGLNLFPGAESDGTLTDEQISLAMKFLSDLDFVPIEDET